MAVGVDVSHLRPQAVGMKSRRVGTMTESETKGLWLDLVTSHCVQPDEGATDEAPLRIARGGALFCADVGYRLSRSREMASVSRSPLALPVLAARRSSSARVLVGTLTDSGTSLSPSSLTSPKASS